MGPVERFVAAALRQRPFVLLCLAAFVVTGLVAWREVLAVPSGAIEEIEARPLVFVKTASGSFERRDVALGQEAEGWVEVRSGVKEGEEVATTGSFLLKSELLKGSMAVEE